MKVGFQISNIKYPIRGILTRVSAALTALATVVLAALASSSVAWAQTCPACYNNAAAQSPGLLQALKAGILVMMFPTLIMFILIFTVFYRRRNSFQVQGDAEGGKLKQARQYASVSVCQSGRLREGFIDELTY